MTADWRGTPIAPGAIVVYGAGVGRSIAQVEGVVEGFTKSGRVRVTVIRRSYGGGEKPTVDVGADRLTVVESLAPSTLPTQDERRVEEVKRSIKYYEVMLKNPDKPTVAERFTSTHDYYRHCIALAQKELLELEARLQDNRQP